MCVINDGYHVFPCVFFQRILVLLWLCVGTIRLHPQDPKKKKERPRWQLQPLAGWWEHRTCSSQNWDPHKGRNIAIYCHILPISKGKPWDLLYRGKFWTSVIHRMVWKENPQAPMLPTFEHHEQTHAKMQVLGKLASSPWCGKVVVLPGCHPNCPCHELSRFRIAFYALTGSQG